MPARERAGAPASANGDDRLEQLCAFRIGGEDYAIDIMRVREIIHPLPITRVPRTPPFVVGVFRLRGEVIPLLDVRERLGLPAVESGRRTRFLVVHVAGQRVGLVVDEVCEVVRLTRREIRPAPPLAEGGAPRFFLGVCGGEPASGGRRRPGAERMRLLLNVKALLDPSVPGEAESARAQAEASRRA